MAVEGIDNGQTIDKISIYWVVTKSFEKNNKSEGEKECQKVGRWFPILYEVVRGDLSSNIWTFEQRPGGRVGWGKSHVTGPDLISM